MQQIVDQISYKPGWAIIFNDDGPRPFIQVSVDETAEAARCPFTGDVTPCKGAKRYLSPHMCKQEIVGACFGAIQDAEMHELREWFRYRGRSIYNPHFDVDKLAEFATLSNMEMRKNAMTMEEEQESEREWLHTALSAFDFA